MIKNADAPAFSTGNEIGSQPGLSKREFIAAMAMQGILSNRDLVQVSNMWNPTIQQCATRCADILLSTLSEEIG